MRPFSQVAGGNGVKLDGGPVRFEESGGWRQPSHPQALRELSMFESHFGFQHQPFAATPDPRSWFATPRLREMVDELTVRLETGQGICLLTGAAGLGKSLICRVVAQELAAPCHVLYLAAPAVLAPRSLFQTLLSELDHSLPGLDLHELRLALLQTLREQVRADRPCVLLVDEAHLLPRRLFEELRALTVLDEQAQPLLRLMLAGQPRLEELLTGAEFDALNQQVATHQLLESLSLTESVEYILHRVYWAGGDTAGLFSIPALDFIVQACSGIPRLLNRLCDQCLLVTEAAQLSQVDLPQVETALDSLRHLPLAWNEEFLRRRGLVTDSPGRFAEVSSQPLDPDQRADLDWNELSTSEDLPQDSLATHTDPDDVAAEDMVEADLWPAAQTDAGNRDTRLSPQAVAAPALEQEEAADDDLSADLNHEPAAPIAFPWRNTPQESGKLPTVTGDFEPVEEAFERHSPEVSSPGGLTFDERALAEEWSRRLWRDLPQVPLSLPPEPPADVAHEGRVPPPRETPQTPVPTVSPMWNATTVNSPRPSPARHSTAKATAPVPAPVPGAPAGLLTPRLATGSLTERSLEEGDWIYDVVEPEEPDLAVPRARRPRLVNGISVVAETVANGKSSATTGPSKTSASGIPDAATATRPVADLSNMDHEEPQATAVAVTHPAHEVPAPRSPQGAGLGRLFTVLRHKLDASRSRGQSQHP